MSEILANLMTILDEEHARAIIEYRRVTIKKPLTAYGAKLLAGKLAAWGDPNEAADIMMERLWRGFEVEWMRKPSRPTKPSAVDAMNSIFQERGWSNEPEFVSSDNGNGQRLPASHDGSQGAVVDLRAGADWTRGSRHH